MTILLRPWNDAVSPDLFEALRAEEVYRFLPAPPPDSEEQFCARHGSGHSGTALVYTAHLDSDGEPAIGLVSIEVGGPDECSIGFMLAPSFWGQGFAKRVIHEAIAKISSQLNQRKVTALVDSRNTASLRALIACGFSEVGRRETMLKREASVDLVLQLII